MSENALVDMLRETGCSVMEAATKLARESGADGQWRKRPGHEMVGLAAAYLAELDGEGRNPGPVIPAMIRGMWCMVPLALGVAPNGGVLDARTTEEAGLKAGSHKFCVTILMEEWETDCALGMLREHLEGIGPRGLTSVEDTVDCLDRMDRLGTGRHTLAFYPGDNIEVIYGRYRTTELVRLFILRKRFVMDRRGANSLEIPTLEKHFGRRTRGDEA